MGKYRRGGKCIGRRKRRTKQNQAEATSQEPNVLPDHTYSTGVEHATDLLEATSQEPNVLPDHTYSTGVEHATDLLEATSQEPNVLPDHTYSTGVEHATDLLEATSQEPNVLPDHTYSTGVEHATDLLEATSQEPNVLPDHTYSTGVEHATDLLSKPCGSVGAFTDCSCLVHEDVNVNSSIDAPSNLQADEYFLIWNGIAHKYDEEDELDFLTFQCLKQDALYHEQDLTVLGFNIAKTTDRLHLLQYYEKEAVSIKLSVTVNLDLTPLVSVHGKPLPTCHPVYQKKSHILSYGDLQQIVDSVCCHSICCGNADQDYILHFGDKGHAYLEADCGAEYTTTIRADSCTLLAMNIRCHECSYYRRVLRSKEKRISGQSSPMQLSNAEVLTSSKPNSSMTKEELARKSKLLRTKAIELEHQNKRLKVKMELEKLNHADLNETDAAEMNTLVSECTPQVEQIWPDSNSFQRIFWEEQIKFNSLKSKSTMRWHPLIVKWALFIKSKSSKAYQAIRDLGFVSLPSERTLYDYSHCIESKLGFQPESIDMLIKECTSKGMYDDDWKCYVGLLQDEIKVKDDLVYCPTTGQLIGFVHLDNTGDQILAFERELGSTQRELATSALVLMVRGTGTDLKFPLAAFSTSGLNAPQLHTVLWRAIELLEIEAGLKVLFVTCDGAGQNRKFFEMHQTSNTEEPINCCRNPYADDDRKLYFISDVPHLLKTTRNCFANSQSHRKTRRLWKDGRDILWTHIVRLYEEHIENNLFTKARLTRSHIDLTAFSQMKVNLAAQVLSNKVAAQLEQDYGDDVKETVQFIRHMNRFFDCLNTRNIYEGGNKINHDLDAYRNVEDPRLVYLEDTFLGYFQSWKLSAESRPGNFSSKERAQMQLSSQTLDGLKISVRSIVACVRYLLKQGTPFVLTEVFNQDILEQHFGHYRHKGGANDNPTIDNVRHTLTTLRVIGSTAMAPLRGNTKRRKRKLEIDHSPLLRKKSRSSNS